MVRINLSCILFSKKGKFGNISKIHFNTYTSLLLRYKYSPTTILLATLDIFLLNELVK